MFKYFCLTWLPKFNMHMQICEKCGIMVFQITAE